MEFEEYLIKLRDVTNNDFEKKDLEEDLIKKAEDDLGLIFPKSYSLFLKILNCGGIESFEIYGIIPNNYNLKSIPNAIWLTLDERNCNNIDNKIILISQSIEYFYAIDLNRFQNERAPIIDYIPGIEPIKCEIVAEDFENFMVKELEKIGIVL